MKAGAASWSTMGDIDEEMRSLLTDQALRQRVGRFDPPSRVFAGQAAPVVVDARALRFVDRVERAVHCA